LQRDFIDKTIIKTWYKTRADAREALKRRYPSLIGKAVQKKFERLGITEAKE
jgi:hypothetical protein